MAEDRKLDVQEEKSEPAARSTEEEFDEDDNSVGELEDESKEQTVPISELRKVRAEAAKYRKRLRALENRVEREQKEAELTKLEETDRLKAIAEEAVTRAKALREKSDLIARRAAVISVASALGFHNPRDAAFIIDTEQIEVDDDGTLDEEKVDELVRSLAESKPYLMKEQNDRRDAFDFGPTNPPSSNLPRPKLRTKDQVDRLKRQSNEAMRSGRMTEAVRLYNQAWEMERSMRKSKGGK